MGWTIQHLPGWTECVSYGATADALDAAAKALPPDRAKALDVLRDPRADAWIDLTVQQAAAIRDALDAAADRMRWRPAGRRHLPLIRDLATAASTAARSGRPWQWH